MWTVVFSQAAYPGTGVTDASGHLLQVGVWYVQWFAQQVVQRSCVMGSNSQVFVSNLIGYLNSPKLINWVSEQP